MKLVTYFPVYLPFLMILIKNSALLLMHDGAFFESCLVPLDIAYSGFAFDVYAFGMIFRQQWLWPGASEWLKLDAIDVTTRQLRRGEGIIVLTLIFWHFLIFLVAMYLAPSFYGVYWILGVALVSALTYILPIWAVEGRLQRL